MKELNKEFYKRIESQNNNVKKFSADEKRKKAEVLEAMGYHLKMGYYEPTDEQWQMIDTLIEQIYMRRPNYETENKQENQEER